MEFEAHLFIQQTFIIVPIYLMLEIQQRTRHGPRQDSDLPKSQSKLAAK